MNKSREFDVESKYIEFALSTMKIILFSDNTITRVQGRDRSWYIIKLN